MPSGPYTYDFPRPMVTVDAVVFRPRDGGVDVLLVRRDKAPFAGHWALPGGFVGIEEPLDTAAARELAEETAVTGVVLSQLYTFGDPGRDPRGRTISVVYTGETNSEGHEVRGGDDAAEAGWFAVADLPRLAFDHDRIIAYAVKKRQQETKP